jgi:anti-sigma factor RsiW
MPAHDEFRELGALAAIGQITAPEHEDLSAHLRECPECREAYADYSRILRQDLPQADPARFRSKQTSLHPTTDAELRERFLARARAHGADFSREVDQRITVDRRPAPVLRMRLAVATAAVFAIAAGLTLALALNEEKRGSSTGPHRKLLL